MNQKSATLLQQFARNQHISEILYVLRTEESLSRAELSRKTGLAKSSMSSIIQEMLELGFICELTPIADGVGKPSTQLILNTRCRGAIGVEINPGYVAVVLTDLLGKIQWKNILPIAPRSPIDSYFNCAVDFITQAITEAALQNLPVLGIGVGVPGTIDPATGREISSSSMNWSAVPVWELWGEKFQLPVFVDTEANMGAVGEHLYGCARDIDTFLYIDQSFGFQRNIGLSMMLEGKLWRGVAGKAGRIGHMVLDPGGPICECGQAGCWRVMTSDEMELQHAIEALQHGRTSLLQQYAADDYQSLTVDIIHQAAIQGDALAREVLKQRLIYTELGISNLINIFDPGVVILSYSYTTIDKPEVDEIMIGLSDVVKELMQDIRTNEAAERRHARHDTNAALLGAASMVLNRFMNNPKGI